MVLSNSHQLWQVMATSFKVSKQLKNLKWGGAKIQPWTQIKARKRVKRCKNLKKPSTEWTLNWRNLSTRSFKGRVKWTTGLSPWCLKTISRCLATRNSNKWSVTGNEKRKLLLTVNWPVTSRKIFKESNCQQILTILETDWMNGAPPQPSKSGIVWTMLVTLSKVSTSR